MQTTIEILGNPMQVQLTKRAERALDERVAPLVAEMRLHFGCLITKRVVFTDDWLELPAYWLTPKLAIHFQALVTRSCNAGELARGAPLEAFPSAHASSIAPRWLQIDYRKKGWTGDFGLRFRRRQECGGGG